MIQQQFDSFWCFQTQWLSLLILIVGVAMVQLSDAKESNVSSATAQNQNKFFGFCVALFACFLSGLAGIYFEKILKGNERPEDQLKEHVLWCNDHYIFSTL